MGQCTSWPDSCKEDGEEGAGVRLIGAGTGGAGDQMGDEENFAVVMVSAVFAV